MGSVKDTCMHCQLAVFFFHPFIHTFWSPSSLFHMWIFKQPTLNPGGASVVSFISTTLCYLISSAVCCSLHSLLFSWIWPLSYTYLTSNIKLHVAGCETFMCVFWTTTHFTYSRLFDHLAASHFPTALIYSFCFYSLTKHPEEFDILTLATHPSPCIHVTTKLVEY